MTKILCFFLIFVCFGIKSAKSAEILQLNPKFIQIISKIESNNDDLAIGDKGKAISRFQIHKICFIDAKNYDKSIDFEYSSLTNKNNAIKVLTAYCNRYERAAVKNNDFESLARLWNSGPGWRKKKELTNNYWKKFLANY